MAFNRGFNANQRFSGGNKALDALVDQTRHFYLKPGQQTQCILLDDDPVNIVRWRMWRKGDKTANRIRLTAKNPNDLDQNARECPVANEDLRNDSISVRRFAYLTCIDLTPFQGRNGQTFHHWKYLIELGKTEYEGLMKLRDQVGSLVGLVCQVFRPQDNKSAVIGKWSPLIQGTQITRVDLRQFFANSPALPRLIEGAQRNGVQLTQPQALEKLIAACDYDTELDNYSPEAAQTFIAYASPMGLAGLQQGQQPAMAQQGYTPQQAINFAPPAPPTMAPSQVPTMTPQAAPQFAQPQAMQPASHPQQFAQAPAAQAAPLGAHMGQPPQAAPLGAHVGQPPQAQPIPNAPTAPPAYPDPASAAPPAFNPQPQATTAPTAMGQPPIAPAAPAAPAAPQQTYDFTQGWQPGALPQAGQPANPMAPAAPAQGGFGQRTVSPPVANEDEVPF